RQLGNGLNKGISSAMKIRESSIRALRVTSDSMYDPDNGRESFMPGDKVMVDSCRKAEDRDFVVVAFDGHDYLMRLSVESGARTFRFTAPDQSGICLSESEATITGVATETVRAYATHLKGPLKWLGDDIGLCNDTPISVNLADCTGRQHMLFLREALLAVDQ